MNAPSRLLLASLVMGLATALGCGDDTENADSTASTGSQGQGGEDDGKFHPPANGTPLSEADACSALLTALTNKRNALPSCIFTVRTCPSLVQAVGGEPCLQYDEGTIAGCVSYYGDAVDCADLMSRSDDCAFEAIEASAPAGCP